MKRLIVLFLFLTFSYASCPSSSFFGTTKCKISIDDVNVVEGNDSTKTITFTVSSNDTVNKDIKVDFSTKDGSATAGEDYESNSGTVIIPKNSKTATVSITIYGDTKAEDDEDFFVDININSDSTSDAQTQDNEGKGLIENDDTSDNSGGSGDNGGSSGSADLIVDDDGKDCSDANYTKITDALKDAKDGDVIKVCKGEYSDEIHIDKKVTIYGTDKDDVNITNKVYFESDANLSNVTIDFNYEGVQIEDENVNPILDNVKVIAGSHAIYATKVHNLTIIDSYIKTTGSGTRGILTQTINDLNITNSTIISEKDIGILFGDSSGHNLYIQNSKIEADLQGIWTDNINDAFIKDTNVTIRTYEGVLFGCNSGHNLVIDGGYFEKFEDSKEPSEISIATGNEITIKNATIVDHKTVGILFSLESSNNCKTDEKISKVTIENAEINATKEAIYARNVGELNIKNSKTISEDNDGVYVKKADSINFYHNYFESKDDKYAVHIEDLADSSKISNNRFNDSSNGKDIYIENDEDLLVNKNCYYGEEVKSEVEDGDSDSKGFYQNFYGDVYDKNANGAIDEGDDDKIVDKVEDYHYLPVCMADELSNGEYNDVDNYLDRNGDQVYKRLFCTPLNVFSTDDDAKIIIEKTDSNLTQIIDTDDGEVNYNGLYAKNITSGRDDESGKVCGSGTKKCIPEKLKYLGSKMDVNESWFDVSENDEGFIKKDWPKCSGKCTYKDGCDKEINITNVDPDTGKIIIWNADAQDNDVLSCRVNFINIDYDKPFVIHGQLRVVPASGSDYAAEFNMHPGMYFIERTLFNAASNIDGIILKVNTKFFDGYPKDPKILDYDIVRMYVKSVDTGSSINGAWQGYVFDKSYINYTDCNGDGKIDENDIDCQRPDRFLLWVSGKADNSSKDDLNLVIKQGYFAGYIYNNGKKIGDENMQTRIIFDQNDDIKVFIGAMNSYKFYLPKEHSVKMKWYKAASKYKYWLGDFDECIYTPQIYVKNNKRNEGSENIPLIIKYLNSATRKAMCDNDWHIKFDYNITQRYTDSADKEGNATEGVDYKGTYNDTIDIARKCSNCSKEECLHPKEVNITDIKFVTDKLDEGDELFDLNFTNFENCDGENVIMTIVDVPPATSFSGFFDIYDINRADKENDKSGVVGDADNEDRNITTKITNQKFTLTIGSFKGDDQTLQTHTKDKDGDDLYVKYGVAECSDENKNSCESELYISNKLILNEEEYDVNFTISKAVKIARAFIKACVYENNETNKTDFYSYEKCDGNTKCTDSDGNPQKCIKKLYSTDTFAIRPYEFIIISPAKIKAGEEFNITVKAVDKNGDAVKDYNETLTLNDNNVTIKYKDNNESKGCNTATLSGDDVKFKDGVATITLTYPEAGDVNFSAKEATLFAKTDEKDSKLSGDLDSNITASAPIEIKFTPHHFDVSYDVSNFNGGDFTYVSNDLEMNSTLRVNVKAKNKDGNVTKNYNKKC